MIPFTIFICVPASMVGVNPCGPPKATHSSGLLLMSVMQVQEVTNHLGEMMVAVQEVFCLTWNSSAREGHCGPELLLPCQLPHSEI